MAVYVIGDLQGCYTSLQNLLTSLEFNSKKDTVWFTGDLVNRGPDSLKTLRFVKSLGNRAITVLGNHDLHLLAVHYAGANLKANDTFDELLAASDIDELMAWLRFRPLMHHDIDLNFTLVHAGIFPGWSISQSLSLAKEIESTLQQNDFRNFLTYTEEYRKDCLIEQSEGMARLCFISNVLTRIRYLSSSLVLNLVSKGAPIDSINTDVIPWFEFKQSAFKLNRIAFGHWSSLENGQYGNCFSLDSNCARGEHLSALQIDKKTPRWFKVACNEC